MSNEPGYNSSCLLALRHSHPAFFVRVQSSFGYLSCPCTLPCLVNLILCSPGANWRCGWEAVGQNVASHLPLLSAQLSGRAPHPRFTQEMRPNFIHLQARQAWSLGLCAGNGVNHQSITFCFLKFPSTHCTNFCSKGTHNQKKSSYPKVCSGRKTVRWPQSNALRTLFGHLCLRKGWPSSGDAPPPNCPSTNKYGHTT